MKFATDGLGVNFAALVAKDRALRHDSQFRYRRQRIDETPGNAVTEIFQFRVAGGIFEWQSGKGVNVLGDSLWLGTCGGHRRSLCDTPLHTNSPLGRNSDLDIGLAHYRLPPLLETMTIRPPRPPCTVSLLRIGSVSVEPLGTSIRKTS